MAEGGPKENLIVTERLVGEAGGGGGWLPGADVGSLFLIGDNMLHCMSKRSATIGWRVAYTIVLLPKLLPRLPEMALPSLVNCI